MQDSVSVRTPAKINLTLDILGKRYDGYHFVKTIMQTIAVFDKIVVEPNQEDTIRIFCDTEGIPCDSKNLVYKAAIAFFEHIQMQPQGIDIHIDKSIPAMAGLAGGSSDAAGMIVALNEMLNTNLSEDTLCEIAEKIGADVPFCIKGGTAVAEGVGDIITQIPDIPECYILVVKPDINISTPEAYAKFDMLEFAKSSKFEDMVAAIATQNLEEMSALLFNALEYAADCDEINDIKNQMLNCGAMGALMSGSGSAVYGIFEKKKFASKCAEIFEDKYSFVEVCTPHFGGVEII